MKILLLLIILIILWPLIMGWKFYRSMRRQVRDIRRQAYGNGNGGYRTYDEVEEPAQPGKVLSDVEEDAEWESVDAPRVESTTPPRTDYAQEEQVTDAEFEEVK